MNTLSEERSSLGSSSLCVDTVYKKKNVQEVFNSRGFILRFVAGGHQDSVARHMGGHVLNRYSYVESPG